MTGLRYADVEYRDNEFMDLTSLTQDEFAESLPSFETAFQERMLTYRLDGRQRTGRGYVTYDNCPLPTPEDRLLFILVYLSTDRACQQQRQTVPHVEREHAAASNGDSRSGDGNRL